MGNVALVVLLDELLLLGRPFRTKIDDHKMHSSLILLVETDGSASLPLGIESALAEDENVIGLAANRPFLDVIAADEWAVLAVTRVIKPPVKYSLVSRHYSWCSKTEPSLPLTFRPVIFNFRQIDCSVCFSQC